MPVFVGKLLYRMNGEDYCVRVDPAFILKPPVPQEKADKTTEASGIYAASGLRPANGLAYEFIASMAKRAWSSSLICGPQLPY